MMRNDDHLDAATSTTPPGLNASLWRAVALWLVTSVVAFAVIAWGFTFAAERFPIDQLATSGATEANAGAYPPPDFRLPTLDGSQLGPPDLLGDVVVMELWATWCGPCRLQAQIFEQLHDEYGDRGVHFLAINSGEDESTINSFVNSTPFSYPVLLDPQQTVQSRYRSSGLPTVMVVDTQGQISFLQVSVVDAATLRREIEKALQPPTTSV